MNYTIRELKENEQNILADFLHEAIYVPEGEEAPAKGMKELLCPFRRQITHTSCI